MLLRVHVLAQSNVVNMTFTDLPRQSEDGSELAGGTHLLAHHSLHGVHHLHEGN